MLKSSGTSCRLIAVVFGLLSKTIFEFPFDENFRLDCFSRCVTVMFGVYIPHEL